MIQLKFLILIPIYLISIPGIAFPINWEFVTSATNSQGIEAAYFIDTDEIKTFNGIRGYREKRIYTRKRSLNSIGVMQVVGYYDCVNRNFVELQFAFLSPEEKMLDWYEVSGYESKWKPIINNIIRSKFNFACEFQNKRSSGDR
ncbi:MAG: hypothetical protein ACE5H1_01720 [Thermodesulfobacteriota bacterium]